MPNINIPISEELHKQTKLAALMAGKTLKQYILDALDEAAPEETSSRGGGKR